MIAPAPAAAAQTIGYPTFSGPDVPPPPVGYTTGDMMRAMYDREKRGTDFWMDRLLARRGADPAGDWLMTRGRAVFMKSHDPSVIGFGGDIAYWESIDGRDAYSVELSPGTFTEKVDERLQTPSYWQGTYTSGSLRLTVRKFITDNNSAVADLTLTNDGDASQSVRLRASSPYTTTPDGNELTGVVDAKNKLTTVFPRLSGDGFTAEGTDLVRSVSVAAGQSVRTKVVMGFLTDEIPASAADYRSYRAATPQDAFGTHVRAYNRWWADNVPYIDVPDPAIKKSVYYRWWLMRFNYLDANIPGNDFQFPTSVEGALGYNNAIALTVPMFIDDLKYLRNPVYSYGPWVSVGEVSGNGRYTDNPGDPENWSNSYTQYISEAAWRSYQVHGGQPAIAGNLAHYAEQDVKGQLDFYDRDRNNLIEYDWGALTGNDADAVSFHWKPGRLDRTESAYVYSNALAAAQAYETVGDTAKAAEMRTIAGNVQRAVVDVLWDPQSKVLEHRHVESNTLVPWKEINNFYPYSVGLMPNTADHREALRLFADETEYPLFPFYTANQKDKAAAAEQGKPGTNNFSQINSTVQFRLFSSALRNYPSPYITAEMYKKLLYWNAWSQYIGGDTRWPDANEFWADWNPVDQSIDYRSWIHHTILGSSNWTVVEDVAGLRPRNDDNVELSPIDIGWSHFTVNNLRYRDSDLTIVWDDPADGVTRYPGVPQGYSVYVDGKRAFTLDRLTAVVWDPATGAMSFPGERATVKYNRPAWGMKAPSQVVHRDPRMVDLFAKAGVNLTSGGADLASGATASASYTAPGTSAAAAVDGFTINKPFWGSKGSPDAQDSYELDLGSAKTFDDIRVHFRSDRAVGGYAEPAMYQVQYFEDGAWITIPRQAKTPAAPTANHNRIRFPAVTAQRVRLVMTHQPGFHTGLTEVKVFRTGGWQASRNTAPSVLARVDKAFNQPGQLRLVGRVKDDALPSGTLTSTWTAVSGPGEVTFAAPGAVSTQASFGKPGVYVVRLTANDGAASASSDVTVTVTDPGGAFNVAPSATASASYTSGWENVEAINDGIEPTGSADSPRWGTWPETGQQWAELTWATPQRLDGAGLYFFDDGGGVRVPSAWKLQYWDGSTYADLPGTYPVAVDQFNNTSFPSVSTTRLRAVLTSGVASVGLVEFKAFAETPSSVRAVHQPTPAGRVPTLPATVTRVYADGTRLEAPVTWQPIEASQVATGGKNFTVRGIVDGTGLPAVATVWVRATDQVAITYLDPETVVTRVGVPPALPPTATATFNDGSRDNVGTTVTWAEVDPASYAQPGTFTVTGQVPGTSLTVQATVEVKPGG
ncbi:Ig-like domain-containing protein [Saccharothrix deserti]|uniref:Ig-like domain-containing protein n=1 Tax=Saccharothrix deserti TaxID=2593674 RepID=UPI001EE4281B|nr:discoidin domain-containing protein [Saccharothrix deserti]